uniref:Uncharacterized protein n=1 Tax=Anguilla anguilla TaxID=7936 RepID=A0A0E9T6H4_ANGAN
MQLTRRGLSLSWG